MPVNNSELDLLCHFQAGGRDRAGGFLAGLEDRTPTPSVATGGYEVHRLRSVLPPLAMTLDIVDHPLLHDIMARLRDRDTLIDVVS